MRLRSSCSYLDTLLARSLYTQLSVDVSPLHLRMYHPDIIESPNSHVAPVPSVSTETVSSIDVQAPGPVPDVEFVASKSLELGESSEENLSVITVPSSENWACRNRVSNWAVSHCRAKRCGSSLYI